MSQLEYQNFSLTYGKQEILHNINLSIFKNQITVIVGQSGSGKSTLLKATMGLLNFSHVKTQGKILLNEKEFNPSKQRENQIGIVFQNPLTYFDDFKTIEDHFYEVLSIHFQLSKIQAHKQAIAYLKQMGLEENILNKYPFELSGGMAQRVYIALTLCMQPQVILADEPTSSLDVVSQKQILDYLLKLKDHFTFVFVTHNIDVAKYIADQIVVIKEGKIIEQGPMQRVLDQPKHPYTRQLIEKGNV